MKRILLSTSVIAVAAVLLVSCKKDRVCECTVGGSVNKRTFNDAGKRQAKDACTSFTYGNANGTSTKVECELKK
jgi:hypothetical protein